MVVPVISYLAQSFVKKLTQTRNSSRILPLSLTLLPGCPATFFLL